MVLTLVRRKVFLYFRTKVYCTIVIFIEINYWLKKHNFRQNFAKEKLNFIVSSPYIYTLLSFNDFLFTKFFFCNFNFPLKIACLTKYRVGVSAIQLKESFAQIIFCIIFQWGESALMISLVLEIAITSFINVHAFCSDANFGGCKVKKCTKISTTTSSIV